MEWVCGDVPSAINKRSCLPSRVKRLNSSSLSACGDEDLARSASMSRGTDTRSRTAHCPEAIQLDKFPIAQAGVHQSRTSEHLGDNVGTVIRRVHPINQPSIVLDHLPNENLPDLFRSPRQGIKPKAIRFNHSPDRPRIPSKFFKPSRTRHVLEVVGDSEHLNWHSEPDELDPNMTLSYLTESPELGFRGRKHGQFDRLVSITPAFLLTSSSEYSSDYQTVVRRQHDEEANYGLHHGLTTEPLEEHRVMTHPRRHLSPKPKTSSSSRPTSTAHMNRTAASALRQHNQRAAIRPESKREEGHVPVYRDDDDEQWETSRSDTEKASNAVQSPRPGPSSKTTAPRLRYSTTSFRKQHAGVLSKTLVKHSLSKEYGPSNGGRRPLTEGKHSMSKPKALSSAPKHINHHHIHITPRFPGHYPTSTSEDHDMTGQDGHLSPKFLDKKGHFSPSSGAIRLLCPRGSSLVHTGAKMYSDRDSSADKGFKSGLHRPLPNHHH
ncbi:hypothetical protein ANO11243_074040 [Dothideomycetidae sp. 11243]|nr:hypothetical protein ANO11243_074040 [fungal sp. No.11243]